MKIHEITDAIESFAPPALQEGYDNTGYQVGDPGAECTGVMLCVDPTEEIVEEAAARGCNLLVTHHPLLFKGLKRVTGRNRPERVLAEAIRRGVTVYSSHTALDSTPGGVSWRMGSMLGLTGMQTLAPVAPGSQAGLGVVGNLPAPADVATFAAMVKNAFGTPVLRLSRPKEGLTITRVALCGGAGADLLPESIAHGAQALVTADCKLNCFLDHAADILLVDAGHFETEQCTKRIFFDVLTEKFPNFAVCYSEKEQNPVLYL